MRTNKPFWLIFLGFTGLLTPLLAETTPWEDPNTPRLEIRKYKFGKHAGFDRLVLEFERKDQNTNSQPKTLAAQSETPREFNIQVENALLLGAIPESLINESFANKSRFLSAITVNMDSPKTGFSFKASMKGGASHVKAQWLSSPPRLVIDAYGAGQMAKAPRETLSIERGTRHPSFMDLMCFPAQANVNLTVLFKPQSTQLEEMQNIRVNTAGTNGSDMPPPPDAIVCYPKASQVLAALSFENKPHEGFTREKILSPAAAILPEAAKSPGEKTAKADDDSDLDPGNIEHKPTNPGHGMPLPPGLLPKAN